MSTSRSTAGALQSSSSAVGETTRTSTIGPAAPPGASDSPGASNAPSTVSPNADVDQRSELRLIGVGRDREDARAKRTVRVEDHRRRFTARAHAELRERRGEVALDRALREEQAATDFAVREAHHDHAEDLLLPERQRRL